MGTPVLVACFDNGTLSRKADVRIKKCVVDCPDGSKSELFTVDGYTSPSYVGVPDSSGAELDQDYAVLIHNKRTGKMLLMDTTFVRFSPQFSNQVDAVTTPEPPTTPWKETREDLTLAFGSKKKQRALVSRKRNLIDEDTLEQVTSAAVESANLDTRAPSTAATSTATFGELTNAASSVIPPWNPGAQKPEDVYSLDCMVTAAFYDQIAGEAEQFAAKSHQQLLEEGHTAIVSGLKKRFETAQPDEDSQFKLAALYYLSCLVEFQRLTATTKTRTNFFVEPGELAKTTVIGEIMLSFIIRTFAVEKFVQRKRMVTVTALLRDKLLAHCFVLTLLLREDLHVDIVSAAAEWNVALQRLETIARSLGCRIEKPTGTTRKTAVLKGPPQSSSNRRKSAP